MGSSLGPTFANYYMCHLENETVKRCPEKMLKIYARYVDDIFVVCEFEENILALREEFERNSILKFTHELENNNQLAFLGTLLTKHNELLSTSVHRKSTNKGDCMNYLSICPQRYKTGVIKAFLDIAYTISSSWALFHQEVDRIKQMFTNNNFPMKLIEESMQQYLEDK